MGALGLIVITTWANPMNPNNIGPNYTLHASRLYDDLLENYNKAVPPMSSRLVNYSAAGTDVMLNLRFWKVDAVDVAAGHLRVKVWWRSKWQDQRLAWDPADYGGITVFPVHAASFADPELSDIWLPDISVYNSVEGLMDSMEPAMARVSHDGTVFWTRPGMFNIACRFSGLVMFPFDLLSCPIDLGGWSAGGSTQGIVADPDAGCVDTSAPEEVSMSSYTEYYIHKVECETEILEYASFPGEYWPILRFRVFLKRATSYYSYIALFPLVAFTAMSFGVFFMSFQVGERLGIGVTSVLTIEVSKVTFSPMVPVCGEMLWLELFFLVNFFFTIASFVESMIVLSLAFHQEERFFPGFLDPVACWEFLMTVMNAARKRKVTPAPKPFSRASMSESAALQILRQPMRSIKKVFPPSSLKLQSTRESHVAEEEDSVKPEKPEKKKPAEAKPTAPVDDVKRLIFFENLFFRLDVDGSNTISFDEMRRLFSFTAISMSNAQIEEALLAADSHERDGQLSRFEFMDLCLQCLWHEPVDQLEAAAINFAEFRLARQRRINMKWRGVATKIDQAARLWMPLTYFIALLCIWNLDLADQYQGRNSEGGYSAMAEGFSAVIYVQTPTMTAVMVLALLAVIVTGAVRLVIVPLARRRAMMIQLAQEENGVSKTEREFTQKRAKTMKNLPIGLPERPKVQIEEPSSSPTRAPTDQSDPAADISPSRDDVVQMVADELANNDVEDITQ